MENSEAIALVSRIADYYPGWLTRLDEEEKKRTMASWAKEFETMGELRTVGPLVWRCFREKAGDFPPGIFVIHDYVKKEYLRHYRQQEDRRLLAAIQADKAEFLALPEEVREANRERFRQLIGGVLKQALPAPQSASTGTERPPRLTFKDDDGTRDEGPL